MDEIVSVTKIPHPQPWKPCIPPYLIRGGAPDFDNDTEANGFDMAWTGSPNVITNQYYTHRALGPGGAGSGASAPSNSMVARNMLTKILGIFGVKLESLPPSLVDNLVAKSMVGGVAGASVMNNLVSSLLDSVGIKNVPPEVSLLINNIATSFLQQAGVPIGTVNNLLSTITTIANGGSVTPEALIGIFSQVLVATGADVPPGLLAIANTIVSDVARNGGMSVQTLTALLTTSLQATGTPVSTISSLVSKISVIASGGTVTPEALIGIFSDVLYTTGAQVPYGLMPVVSNIITEVQQNGSISNQTLVNLASIIAAGTSSTSSLNLLTSNILSVTGGNSLPPGIAVLMTNIAADVESGGEVSLQTMNALTGEILRVVGGTSISPEIITAANALISNALAETYASKTGVTLS